MALAVLCKGRSSAWQKNRILRRVGALTAAAGFLPSWGYFMSTWNPSDEGSRKFQGKARSRSLPRRSRPKSKQVKGVAKSSSQRRNRKYAKDFDSTLGYPGEGPKLAKARRIGRSQVKVIPNKRGKGGMETVPGRRTSAERRVARAGIKLRDGMISAKTRALYATAFLHLWAWAQTSPPDEVSNIPAYDKFLAGYIEHAWTSGATRGEAGNALSASLHMYPNLRGKGHGVRDT